MDAEIRCYTALAELGVTPLPGESFLDAALRVLVASDPLLRPYRYEQAEGMRTAYQAWLSGGGCPGGSTADTLNAFQAGYTAGGKR